MLFWLGVSVRVGVKYRLGLTLSLKLTRTIPNLHLTYFGVQPATSDVIITREKYVKRILTLNLIYAHRVSGLSTLGLGIS